MAIFINPDEPFEYRFEGHSDLGPVYVKPPTKAMYRQLGKIAKKLASGNPDEVTEAAIDGAQLVLDGWALEEDGASVPYEKQSDGKPTEKTVMRLPLKFMTEVVGFALERSTLTEEDRKNSP